MSTALGRREQEAVHMHYPRRQGWKAVANLSQGERDVLEMARLTLGWVSITSLACKYWPLYPERKLWQRAVERCSHYQPRYKTHPIQYLLLTLATVKAWALEAAFSGREDLNRIVYPINSFDNLDLHRIEQKAGIFNLKSLDFHTVYKLVYPCDSEGHEDSLVQDAKLASKAA